MQFKKDLAALAFLSTILPSSATAADEIAQAAYPQRPVTLVVGYPAGADTDALARLLAHYMEQALGQKLNIEYRPGASGNIGAESVARSKPDGYTIYLGVRPNTIHKTMYAHMKYDFSRDLVPVGLVATMPYVMVTGADAPIATLQDLLEMARTHPGALTYGSGGLGSTPHLLFELLQQDVGIDMLHVPYSGAAPALIDVMAGRINVQMAPVAAALPHIQAGKLKPIAVMSPLRVPALRHVPTIEEAGGPGLGLGAWYGLVVPTGAPPHVIATLNQSLNRALMSPGLHEAMARLAFAPPMQPNTPAAFKQIIAEETERWTEILRTRNIKPLH